MGSLLPDLMLGPPLNIRGNFPTNLLKVVREGDKLYINLELLITGSQEYIDQP